MAISIKSLENMCMSVGKRDCLVAGTSEREYGGKERLLVDKHEWSTLYM
jgi:hypothetical protein